MSVRDMTATDAIGLAQRAAMDAWAFMGVDVGDNEAAALMVLDRIESAARGLLGWCREKRRELGATIAKRKKR